MKKIVITLLGTLLFALPYTSALAYPCNGVAYNSWNGGQRCYGSYGGGGWISSTGLCNGGGCYAPILYGNSYACGYYPLQAVVTAPPSGIGITIFGLNILSINPTLPVAVPAR